MYVWLSYTIHASFLVYYLQIIYEELKVLRYQSKAVIRRTDNAIVKGKQRTGQNMTDITPYRKQTD